MEKIELKSSEAAGRSLDPSDWSQLRQDAHRMLDDMLDHLQGIEDRPVWRPPPPAQPVPLPRGSRTLADVYAEFRDRILPYTIGNTHPGFMGWVHGGGTVVGMLAEMLAAGINPNLGGRDHVPIAIERQITAWMAQSLGWPDDSSGLFVTGSSVANWIGLHTAITTRLRQQNRRHGLTTAMAANLVGYTSAAAHHCVRRGFELSGLGNASLRVIDIDEHSRIRCDQLIAAIEQDKAAGVEPFFIAATSGTIDVGGFDDLEALSQIAKHYNLWLHVDGAIGGIATLSSQLAPRLAGIEHADSLAMDFHKWSQVPYEAGFVMVRDPVLHRQAFETVAAYLSRETRGMAAGSPWPCDFGPDLSRGFKALKVWFSLQVYGADALGAVMEHTCELASELADMIGAQEQLELLAPVTLNIVCFRAKHPTAADELNRRLSIALQESGRVAPSLTSYRGRKALRAAIFNHRTRREHIVELVQLACQLAKEISADLDLSAAPVGETL